MRAKIQFDDEPIVNINITPFVDVMLVLLVIFMVTAQFIVDRGIKLDLPSAQSSEAIQKAKTLTVSILKDATYIIDGKTLNLNNVQKFVNQKFEDKNNVSIVISADKSVPYNALVELMDSLRLIGVSNFALQMNPSQNK